MPVKFHSSAFSSTPGILVSARGVLPCLPEEPGSAHCVFSSKPLCGQDFVYLTHLRTLRAWHIEVLKKYLSNGSLGK